MNQLATITRPAGPAPAALSDPAGHPHALALFRLGDDDRIDRRVAGRALRVASLSESAASGHWFAIAFDASLLAAAEAAHGVRFEPLPEITDPEAHTLAAMIHAATGGETAPDPELLGSLRHVLLWRLLMLPARGRRQGEARGGLAPWQARRTTRHLAAHIDRRVPLGELATIARLSPFHFSRAFARTVGMPPHRYHLHLRMERACTLLARSEMRIIEIALAVGYETPQALARVFVQQHGITPSEWRRRHREG